MVTSVSRVVEFDMKILLVDDDPDLLDLLTYALRREGFDIITAADGREALQCWRAEEPDLVVLDLTMPRLSGFEVCRQIREAGPTPVILLTSSTGEEDVVQGFQLGADDYVRKPFSPRQLVMRIRAVWRRANGAAHHEPVRELRIGDWVLDIDAREARQGDKSVRLTPIESRLLHLLASHLGRVVSASRFVEAALGYPGEDSGLLKTHLSHLRKKLHLPRDGPGSITAVRGAGYRLER